ncbi:MAG: MFS transporter [Methanoregula sp.]|jgi:EmrB/QacA subfamily drug resistance transporter
MTSIITDPRHQKLLLGAAALGILMDGLDGSIVNVALPTIASAFSTDTGTVAWVIITYLLMMAGLVLVFGSIADRGTTKRVFLFGLALFTLGSAACGLSPTLSVLLASRVVQGIGAAMIAAVAPLLCVRYLPPHMLGAALGVLAASSSIGFAAGPALGGIITHILSWHWIFLINIPVGIIGIFLASRVIPSDTPSTDTTPLDLPGAALLFGAMVAGIFALEEVASLGGANPAVIACAGLCVLCSVLFVLRECRILHPFIRLRMFQKWQFSAVLVAFLLINVVYAGVLYLLPFYLSAGMNFNLAVSGLFLLVPPVITGLVSIPFGRWSDRCGCRWFSVAACVVLILFSGIFAIIIPESGYLPLIVGLVLMGLVFGIAGGPAASRIIENAPAGEEGIGSSLMITTIYFGGVLGTAVYATLLTISTAAGGVVTFADLDPAVFLAGFHFTIWAGLILSLIPLVLSALVKDEMKTS